MVAMLVLTRIERPPPRPPSGSVSVSVSVSVSPALSLSPTLSPAYFLSPTLSLSLSLHSQGSTCAEPCSLHHDRTQQPPALERQVFESSPILPGVAEIKARRTRRRSPHSRGRVQLVACHPWSEWPMLLIIVSLRPILRIRNSHGNTPADQASRRPQKSTVDSCVQGYLPYQETHPPRTLPQAYV